MFFTEFVWNSAENSSIAVTSETGTMNMDLLMIYDSSIYFNCFSMAFTLTETLACVMCSLFKDYSEVAPLSSFQFCICLKITCFSLSPYGTVLKIIQIEVTSETGTMNMDLFMIYDSSIYFNCFSMAFTLIETLACVMCSLFKDYSEVAPLSSFQFCILTIRFALNVGLFDPLLKSTVAIKVASLVRCQ